MARRRKPLDELPLKRQAEEFGGGLRSGYYTQAQVEARLCSVKDCGRSGFATWQACVDDRIRRIFCAEHDVELNWNVLQWTGDPDAEAKITAYANDVERRLGRELEVDFLTRVA